ncbi:GGDEF domain-containing protein, partial [candidate division NPL-UPA2 bacterium]|nr:GGDEF domain-containing protein [candidate division NPL-UPA2 bacterium]
VIGLLMILGLLGAIAAKLLQWEYMINREAYKREAEFCIPLVYPFFFLCLLGLGIVLWLRAAPEAFNVVAWVAVPTLALGSAILSPALGVTWRFWHILWLSILSPVDWRAIVEAQNFNRQLKMSFAEVKRYPSPLSLTVIDISQSDQFKGRAMRRAQEELIKLIDKDVRETDAVGRIEGGRIVIVMAHTGSSGAVVQAKRVKKNLEEYLKSLKKKGRITLSIGIASYAPDMASYKDLVEKAQVALLRAKEEGGGISIEGKDPLCIKATTENTEGKLKSAEQERKIF